MSITAAASVNTAVSRKARRCGLLLPPEALYICFSLSYILTGSVCRPEYSSFSAPLSQCRKHVIFYQIDSILLRKGENNYITSSGTRTRHGKTGRDCIGFVSGSYRVSRIGFLVSGLISGFAKNKPSCCREKHLPFQVGLKRDGLTRIYAGSNRPC